MAENQNTAVVEDATYTPHGDDNSLRGWPTSLKIDATHTPHGDGKHKTLRLCANTHGLRVLYFI